MVEVKLIKAIQAAQPNVVFMVANQNSPVPQHVFCEVLSIGDVFIGTPEYSNDEDEEVISTQVFERISLSYNGLVVSEAQAAVKYMARFLESFEASFRLKEQGLSLIRVNDIQKMPVLKDVDMYVTYILDITLASQETDSFNIDVIDKVKIHGDFKTSQYDLEVNI